MGGGRGRAERAVRDAWGQGEGGQRSALSTDDQRRALLVSAGGSGALQAGRRGEMDKRALGAAGGDVKPTPIAVGGSRPRQNAKAKSEECASCGTRTPSKKVHKY